MPGRREPDRDLAGLHAIAELDVGRFIITPNQNLVLAEVRQGERRWTEDELAKVRDALAAEAAELHADIERSESDIASRLDDAVGDAGDDQADVGAKTFEREHDLALTHNARELLVQTEQAVARIDDGTYGTCESCGEPIGKARLQAFPRAVLCVSCKQREERR